MRLPSDIEKKVGLAKEAQQKLVHHKRMHPPPGAPRTPGQPAKKTTIVTGDTPAELEAHLDALASALGPRTAGNKRWGRTSLYVDLLGNFRKLQSKGITLPRNKSLSKKALRMGLGDILRRHGCTELTDACLENNPEERNDLANKMSRVFAAVADTFENTPAKIGKL